MRDTLNETFMSQNTTMKAVAAQFTDQQMGLTIVSFMPKIEGRVSRNTSQLNPSTLKVSPLNTTKSRLLNPSPSRCLMNIGRSTSVMNTPTEILSPKGSSTPFKAKNINIKSEISSFNQQ
jgi:hypothetical protein